MLSRLMTRREQLVLAFLALAILAGAASLWLRSGASSGPDPQDDVAPPQPEERRVPGDTAHAALPYARPPRSENDAAQASGPPPAEEASGATAASGENDLKAAVMGAVRHPGLYRFSPGERVGHLVEHAGGFAADADSAGINLAATLIDGTTLTVPRRRESGRPAPAPAWNPPQYLLPVR